MVRDVARQAPPAPPGKSTAWHSMRRFLSPHLKLFLISVFLHRSLSTRFLFIKLFNQSVFFIKVFSLRLFIQEGLASLRFVLIVFFKSSFPFFISMFFSRFVLCQHFSKSNSFLRQNVSNMSLQYFVSIVSFLYLFF